MAKVDLVGHDIKEWALIIMIGSVAFVFGVVGIGLAVAIYNGAAITFTGSFDLSQYQAVVIGVAMVAIVFVGQQLTSRQNQAATAQADNAWLTDKETKPA